MSTVSAGWLVPQLVSRSQPPQEPISVPVLSGAPFPPLRRVPEGSGGDRCAIPSLVQERSPASDALPQSSQPRSVSIVRIGSGPTGRTLRIVTPASW